MVFIAELSICCLSVVAAAVSSPKAPANLVFLAFALKFARNVFKTFKCLCKMRK